MPSVSTPKQHHRRAPSRHSHARTCPFPSKPNMPGGDSADARELGEVDFLPVSSEAVPRLLSSEDVGIASSPPRLAGTYLAPMASARQRGHTQDQAPQQQPSNRYKKTIASVFDGRTRDCQGCRGTSMIHTDHSNKQKQAQAVLHSSSLGKKKSYALCLAAVRARYTTIIVSEYV